MLPDFVNIHRGYVKMPDTMELEGDDQEVWTQPRMYSMLSVTSPDQPTNSESAGNEEARAN